MLELLSAAGIHCQWFLSFGFQIELQHTFVARKTILTPSLTHSLYLNTTVSMYRSIDLQLCLTGSNRSIDVTFLVLLLVLFLLHLLVHLIIPESDARPPGACHDARLLALAAMLGAAPM